MAEVTKVTMSWNAVLLDKLTSITDSQTKNTIDTTSFDNTGQWESFVFGIGSGEFSISGYMDGAASDGYDELATDFAAGTKRAFILAGETSGDANITGSAGITSLSRSMENGDVWKFDASFKVDGAPTYGNVS